ncbi:uncharacterized protein A4U43_C03F9460 [Asparagus officinalis]|uniref:Phytocyanin domain-containing protein n=1 Tax=Asparagus officinalis TaxID=4686 RepID=A0A5P1FDP1_ASPOF|nr:uncharacterized protein A4U43_C03F9460 [Asparagus officinalis]
MATLRAFTGLITIAVLLRAALGADHVVGGAGGWELTTDLSSWASAETFKTGDTLKKFARAEEDMAVIRSGEGGVRAGRRARGRAGQRVKPVEVKNI